MTTAEFVDCEGLKAGSRLQVETRNRRYEIECLGGNLIRIAGHPEYCPDPVQGRVLEPLIATGKHFRFLLNDYRPVTTSRVLKVRVQQAKTSSIH